MSPEDMLAPVMKALHERTGLDPKLVGDVQIGNCPQNGEKITKMFPKGRKNSENFANAC